MACIAEVERELYWVKGSDDLAQVEAALDEVRADPMNPVSWWPLRAAMRTGHVMAQMSRSVMDSGNWDRVRMWADQGCITAYEMKRIEDADSPVCSAHGPMASAPAIDWHCTKDGLCQAPYWWLDGSFVRRGWKPMPV